MGFIGKAIRRTVGVATLTGAVGLGYLHQSTTVISPLQPLDPVFLSRTYRRYNGHGNPSTQDIVLKRVPLSKIRQNLLDNEGELVVEFTRGVWTSLGYAFQRAYLERKYRGPETKDNLWSADDLSKSTYELGTKISDHFEVVEKTPTTITVRCGDTPRNSGPRDSDGLFSFVVDVNREKGWVDLGLRSVLFTSARKVDGVKGPMPGWMEEAHQWYARLWMVTGYRRILA